jgi:hypothetical protein
MAVPNADDDDFVSFDLHEPDAATMDGVRLPSASTGWPSRDRGPGAATEARE